MNDQVKNLAPEPYFSAYLFLLFRVLSELRVKTARPDTMSREELVELVRDIYRLSDALHNVPLFVGGMDTSFTPEDIERLFLQSYDEARGEQSFHLMELLKRFLREGSAR